MEPTVPHKKPSGISRFQFENIDAQTLSEHYARFSTGVLIEPLTRRKGIAIEGSHYATGAFQIWSGTCRFGMQAKLLEPPEVFAIYLPHAGGFDVYTGSQRHEYGPDEAFVGDLSTIERIRFQEGRRHTAIAFGRSLVTKQLCELLDTPVSKKLEFSAKLDCSSSAIRRISMASALLWSSLANEPEHIASVKFTEHLFQSLALLLLAVVPHNYSVNLGRPLSPAIPRQVKRAVDFMVSNVSMEITIGDLVRECGCSARSLNAGFLQFKGISPLQYLRQIRLDAVRKDLINAKNQSTISQTAQRWGFTHMGRFAALYRQAFGESPSETVRSSGMRLPRP
ncbi:AraC family transcriptional regulator [Rhizobium jaguaris]|uniref:AraC family transcriptional regulator n=1 Tax=Rhizobium jaguaris TaxID=1312183 RepID=A0A387G0M6_9HYPH|nr:AraC family transcriptional regulator [Rhizobium jaguaris]AYG64479.1 AraC family transcriptional regulator [Rhizobium jaguaris]